MRRLALACLLLAAFGAPMSDARAQAQGDAKKEAKERKEEDAGSRREAGALIDAAAEQPKVADVKDPKKDRADRRRRAISYARARWGALLRQPAAQAELRLHARRVARIDAMETVAKTSGKDALLPRIAKLRTKETERFEQRMRWIADGKEPSATREGGP
jgi:hypothetical protein